MGLHLPAHTRDSQKGRPKPNPGASFYGATRPMEMFETDCTPLNQFCVSDGQYVDADVLTVMDLSSRMIHGLRVVPAPHTARDVNLALYDALSCDFRRRHWAPEPKDFYAGLPDWIIVPADNVTYMPGTVKLKTDRGSQFNNRQTVGLLAAQGIELFVTGPGQGFAKGVIEAFQARYSRLTQGLDGDKGRSPEHRAKGANRAIGPSLQDAEQMLIDFVTQEYHFAKHESLRSPTNPKKRICPMDRFVDYVTRFGELNAPLDPDFIFQFLEVAYRQVWDDGIHLRGETYDGPALRGLRLQPRGKKRPQVEVRYDRHGMSRVFVADADTGAYVPVPLRSSIRRLSEPGRETWARYANANPGPDLALTPKQRRKVRGRIRYEANERTRREKDEARQRERRRASEKDLKGVAPKPKPAPPAHPIGLFSHRDEPSRSTGFDTYDGGRVDL